jgi:hypothetical protein
MPVEIELEVPVEGDARESSHRRSAIIRAGKGTWALEEGEAGWFVAL